ncbi:hypothetical protein COO60DRAFT_1272461, partial [Scenedesmus sp. NREL 46B-D3]
FDLQHECSVARLLTENSYAQFGSRYYKQTRGIPTGINPAVYMANFYLFYYEHQFLLRLASFQSALFLVHQFKCTVRFVDDLTCDHNSYISQLLYYNDHIMGGRVRGIYPGCPADRQPAEGEFLVLEHTPGKSVWSFCTLDVDIVSSAKLVETPGGSTWLVTAATRLYDKRMDSCYAGIPIVRYTHISSAISPFAGYNILVSQLHRYQTLITKRSSFVLEGAKLRMDVRMEARSYCMRVLWRKLHRHVTKFYYFVGEMSPHALLVDIWSTCAVQFMTCNRCKLLVITGSTCHQHHTVKNWLIWVLGIQMLTWSSWKRCPVDKHVKKTMWCNVTASYCCCHMPLAAPFDTPLMYCKIKGTALCSPLPALCVLLVQGDTAGLLALLLIH